MANKNRKFETPRTLHDWPLIHNEKALFSFDEFAVTLARLIADKGTKTPLTIGVSGRWGSGKTTLLHRVERMLSQTETLYEPGKPAVLEFCNGDENPQTQFRPCRTVWFNAWKYADEEQLLVALIRVIVQEMTRDDIVSKVLGKLLDPSYPRRDVVGTVLGWFSIKVGDVGVALNTGEAKETPFAQKTAMLDLFDDAFDRLLAAWVHRSLDVDKVDPEKGVLVVFIDDLDRCLPPKMVQVLEAIKLFMDKRGCVFLLGADTEIVRRAVEKQYAEAGVTGQGAGDYLEKIVQLRFELPPATHDTMQELLDNEKMIGEDWGDSWRLLVTGAEINPRKVKTFVNDLNLQWAMLVNSGQAQGVNRADFNTWQVLARIAPRNFLDQIRERLEDHDLRYKFILDAIKWSQGEESLNATFQQYDSWRLKRVLRDLAFGDSFNPQVLNAFVHLTAPPQEELAAEQPARKVEEGQFVDPGDMAFSIEMPQEKAGSSTGKPKPPEIKTRDGLEVFTFAKMPFMKIPAGKFLMGSKDDNELAYDDERPQHTVELLEYYMARFPVTNEDYVRCKSDFKMPKGLEKHPVVKVSWLDAIEYVRWLNDTFKSDLPKGYAFVLPTEAQWEKAARGEYGNEWPWGNEFDRTRCNSSEGGKSQTTQVDAYPAGASPYGVLDMVGNVWEWTHTLKKNFPYLASDGREREDKSGIRVLRGGSVFNDHRNVRCAFRYDFYPAGSNDDLGFRVCVSPVS